MKGYPEMINTLNIKITTSQSNRPTDPNKAQKLLQGHSDFGTNISKALKKNPPKSLSQYVGISQANQPVKKKGNPINLESTPKGPFAPEKAPNLVSINRRELALLKKILLHCGLSQKQVKGFLKDLTQSRPHEVFNQAQPFQKRSLPRPSAINSPQKATDVLGKIPRTDSSPLEDLNQAQSFQKRNLPKPSTDNSPLEELDQAQFFEKRSLPEPSADKSQKKASLDPWVLPHVETVLQRFGLTAQEINQTFQGTGNAQGRLNWTQFVINLKKIQNRSSNGIQIAIDPSLGRVIGPNPESIGLQGSHANKSGQISLNDFITSLERIWVRTNPKNTLAQPQQIGTDQNSEKISSFELNHDQASSPSTHAGLVLSDPLTTSKPDRNRRPTLNAIQRIKLKHKSKPVAEISQGVASKGLAQPAAEEFPKIFLSADNHEESQKPKPESITASDSSRGQPKAPQVKSIQGEASVSLPADSGQQSEKSDVSEEGHAGRAQVQKIALPDQVADTAISKTTHLGKPPETSARSFLPAYVADQVGKQIARSLLKDDRVIQLQLKPPELGAVKVALDIQNDFLKLEMTIENSSVKELLRSNIHELRASLMEQGVKLGKVDIQINYDFGQSPSNSQGSFKGPQQGNQGLNGEPAVAENEGQDSQTESLPSAKNNHLLNLVA